MKKEKPKDVVSFDTAVHAKNAGFDGEISTLFGNHYYNFKGVFWGDSTAYLKRLFELKREGKSKEEYENNEYANVAAPRHTELQRWLRDEFDIAVEVHGNSVDKKFGYKAYFLGNVKLPSVGTSPMYEDYDEAFEEAINSGLDLTKYA